jgi:hypothetical protein
MASIELNPSFVLHLCEAAVEHQNQIIKSCEKRIQEMDERHRQKVASMNRISRFFNGTGRGDPFEDLDDQLARNFAQTIKAKIRKIILLARLAEQQELRVTMTEEELAVLQGGLGG